MSMSIERISKEIDDLRDEFVELKAKVDEEFELSEPVKRELKIAREEMDKEFVSHDRIMKRFG